MPPLGGLYVEGRHPMRRTTLALLVLIVAALGGSLAWFTCAAACPATAGGSVMPLFVGAVSGVATWILSSFVGKPILDVEAKRTAAMTMAERYSYMAEPHDQAQEDRVRAARAALRDAATELRAIERGQSQLVRLYCRWCGYDLSQAFLAMNGLRHMSGSPRYDDSTRKNNLNLLYLSLNAHGHLTADEVAELRKLVAEHENAQENEHAD
jgi:hypothetical protein